MSGTATSGKKPPHQGPLGRVVVDEDERIELEFRRSAIVRRLSALFSQLATKQAKSDSLRIMSARFSNGSRALASSFLEQTASRMPRRERSLSVRLKGQERFAFARTLSQRDSAGAHVAHDSAPERVVEVEHEDFLAPAERPPAAG